MSKYRHLNTVFIAIVIIISTALLVGRLFDARFAGGDGYVPHGVATVNGETFQRGEIISSGDAFTVVMINDEPMYLNTNTEIRLDDLSNETHITLIQGNIITNKSLTVHIRDTQLVNDRDLISVTHYSWVDRVDFYQADAGIDLSFEKQRVATPQPAYTYNTIAPHNLTSLDNGFPLSGAQANFWEWFTTTYTTTD